MSIDHDADDFTRAAIEAHVKGLGATKLRAAGPCADCERHVSDLIERVETLQREADDGPGVAVLEEALRQTEAERDRLAAEVERLRVRGERLRSALDSVRRDLRWATREDLPSLIDGIEESIRDYDTPTPEAPDGR